MLLTVNAMEHTLEAETVVVALSTVKPEEIHTHWVEVDGVRYPVKQALEAVLGVDRAAFTSHTARRQFRRLGFATSGNGTSDAALRQARPEKTPPATPAQAAEAFAALVTFLREKSLTTRVADLEHQLVGAEPEQASELARGEGLTEQLLHAALTVRRDVGRVSDVIHAAVIVLALPAILEPGETISDRPSLGPGNDKTRPFDLETDRRVAEFKVALWSGGDMMRKRGVVADLVHLSLDESGRRPELWVAGEAPLHFLRTSRSTVEELLSRAPRRLHEAYTSRFGTQEIPLRTFVREQAAHVQLRDLAKVFPEIA